MTRRARTWPFLTASVALTAMLACTYVYFVRTYTGQILDERAKVGAWFGHAPLARWADGLLDLVPLMCVGAVLVAIVIGLVRRAYVLTLMALAVVAGANLTTQLLKHKIDASERVRKISFEARQCSGVDSGDSDSRPMASTLSASAENIASAAPRLATRPWAVAPLLLRVSQNTGYRRLARRSSPLTSAWSQSADHPDTISPYSVEQPVPLDRVFLEIFDGVAHVKVGVVTVEPDNCRTRVRKGRRADERFGPRNDLRRYAHILQGALHPAVKVWSSESIAPAL